jgi:hypothetical protein
MLRSRRESVLDGCKTVIGRFNFVTPRLRSINEGALFRAEYEHLRPALRLNFARPIVGTASRDFEFNRRSGR